MKNKIKYNRALQELTQEELANAVGCTRQTINAIEGGEYNPSAILTLKLASVFNKHVTEIFELEESDWDCE